MHNLIVFAAGAAFLRALDWLRPTGKVAPLMAVIPAVAPKELVRRTIVTEDAPRGAQAKGHHKVNVE